MGNGNRIIRLSHPTMLRDNGRRGGTARCGLGQTPDDGSAPSHPGISELGETGGAELLVNDKRIIRLSHPTMLRDSGRRVGRRGAVLAKRLMIAPRRLTQVLANWVRQAERSCW
ncbi:MAG: hypothetical protein M5U34_13565 [Chloroflexi bacterium]|nr:hypothetical protein [Chloroflexota bacterium]